MRLFQCGQAFLLFGRTVAEVVQLRFHECADAQTVGRGQVGLDSVDADQDVLALSRSNVVYFFASALCALEGQLGPHPRSARA